MLQSQSNFPQLGERGSVTAELALALPAVSLIIAITLSAFSLQIERMKLVDISATAARAWARGESEEAVRQIVLEMSPIGQENSESPNLLELKMLESFACVQITRPIEIPALQAKVFDLTETQCARKMGL